MAQANIWIQICPTSTCGLNCCVILPFPWEPLLCKPPQCSPTASNWCTNSLACPPPPAKPSMTQLRLGFWPHSVSPHPWPSTPCSWFPLSVHRFIPPCLHPGSSPRREWEASRFVFPDPSVLSPEEADLSWQLNDPFWVPVRLVHPSVVAHSYRHYRVLMCLDHLHKAVSFMEMRQSNSSLLPLWFSGST